jgi:uncharacterized membrane protein
MNNCEPKNLCLVFLPTSATEVVRQTFYGINVAHSRARFKFSFFCRFFAFCSKMHVFCRCLKILLYITNIMKMNTVKYKIGRGSTIVFLPYRIWCFCQKRKENSHLQSNSQCSRANELRLYLVMEFVKLRRS